MREIRWILFLCFILGIVASATCQVNPTRQSMSRLNISNTTGFDNRYQGVKGSPYIMETWEHATLYPSGQGAVKVEHLNFDRNRLELCYREDADGKIFLLNKYLIDSFALESEKDTLMFIKIRQPESSDFIFVEKIGQGESGLYLDRAKRFIKADYEEVYSADRRYDEFKDESRYIIQTVPSGDLYEVIRNRKQMASKFGTYSDQMMKYFKSEKISFSSENDLLEMMKYYKNLLE